MKRTHTAMTVVLSIATGSLVAGLTAQAIAGEPGHRADPPAVQPDAPHANQKAEDSVFMRSQRALGMEVYDREGADAGSIKDLIVDAHTGRLTHAALSIGGWMGIGDKVVLTQINTIRWDPKSERMMLETSKEALKNAPRFDESAWLKLERDQWTKALKGWKGLDDHPERKGKEAEDNEGAEGAHAKHYLARLSDMQDTGVAATDQESEDLGQRRVVIGESLKHVGEIDGAVVELVSRRVPLVVVASGGLLGMGEKLRLVPLPALRMTESTTVLEGITADGFGAIEPVPEAQIEKLTPSDLETYYKPFGLRAPSLETRTASRD